MSLRDSMARGIIRTRLASDAVQGKRASELARVVEAATGIELSPPDISGPVQSHDTGRTSAVPREYAPCTTHAERARAMGGSDSPAATYPILDGAPVGSVATLAGEAAERVAAIDALLATGVRSAGLPGSKRAKRIARAAKHNAKQRR